MSMLPTLIAASVAAGAAAGPDDSELLASVLGGYSAFARETYAACTEHARGLHDEIDRFLASPDEEGLQRARRAWLGGRRVFGRTEVLRFYGGPIDDAVVGVETFLNAWPLDEAYIDGVRGREDSGIINDPVRFPNLSTTLLTLLNERGGEANVSIGWHAIEFLLWGQDHDPSGPGNRSAEAFVDGATPHAARRREYLALCADLLVEHHAQVEEAWSGAPESYAAAFLSEPALGLRRALAGAIILSGFEMAGERLAVVYETGDQEDEHSCFSDNTHVDFLADQEGILAVWFGESRGGQGPGLLAIAERRSPEFAEVVSRRLLDTYDALGAIPVPFDQAVSLDTGETEGRKAVLRALICLEQQAEALSALALDLGFEIALSPGG